MTYDPALSTCFCLREHDLDETYGHTVRVRVRRHTVGWIEEVLEHAFDET